MNGPSPVKGNSLPNSVVLSLRQPVVLVSLSTQPKHTASLLSNDKFKKGVVLGAKQHNFEGGQACENHMRT